jgi:Flp pilus assembly protein TadG
VRQRRRDERGSAVVEFAWLGVLLLVPVMWLVLSVFDVQRGAFATETAARSAARAYALAPNDGQGRSAAHTAARLALEDQGVTGVPVTVTVSCTPYPRNCHSGTSVITVKVRTRVVLPLMPEVLGGDRPSFRLDSSHTVPIGQYQEVDRG